MPSEDVIVANNISRKNRFIIIKAVTKDFNNLIFIIISFQKTSIRFIIIISTILSSNIEASVNIYINIIKALFIIALIDNKILTIIVLKKY